MSVPDSVGKCPPLSEEVEARAVEAACAGFIPEWGRLPNSEAQDWRSDLSHALAAAAPIIAEAGYRQGVEDAKARIQEVKLGPHANREEIETFRAEVDAVLTALTDTEGREPASVEGGRSPSAATTDSDVKTNPVEGEN